jgi:GntR family transcriptional regulator
MSVELSLHIDKSSGIPVYIQFTEQIRMLVHQGILRPEDLMPTVRSLAVDLGINANTVARVYRDLQHEGVLRLERGVGTYVTDNPGTPIQKSEMKKIEMKISDIIRIAKKTGLSAREIAQLIETRWKEDQDHER